MTAVAKSGPETAKSESARASGEARSAGMYTPRAEEAWRSAGNLAIQRLLKSGAIQAKLQISQPGDPLEQEADRIAEEVTSSSAPMIHRKCAACAAGGQSCPACEEEEMIHAKRAEGAGGGGVASADHAAVQNGMRGGGEPLPRSLRSFFEPRFGRDFGDVWIHRDAGAESAAKSINARAFTSGSDVVFAAEQYVPESFEGRKLIAHELAHVLQQRDTSRLLFQRQPATAAEPPDNCDEILARIREVIAELRLRAQQSEFDEWNLQWDNWETTHPKSVKMPDGRLQYLGSVEGHRIQFEAKQQRLRDLLKEYDDCISNGGSSGGGPTREERDWAFKDFPLPIPRPRPEIGPRPWDAPGAPGRTPPRRRVTLQIGGQRHLNLAPDQASVLLDQEYDRLDRKIRYASGEHLLITQNRENSPVSGFFADLLGGATLPPTSIWNEPRSELAVAGTAIAKQDSASAVDHLWRAEQAYQRANKEFRNYKQDTITGAERTEVAIIVIAVVVVVIASGGLALEAVAGAAEETIVGAAETAAEEEAASLPELLDGVPSGEIPPSPMPPGAVPPGVGPPGLGAPPPP